MQEGVLIFPPILFEQIAPIPVGVPRKKIARLFAGLFQRRQSAGGGDDLPELETRFRHALHSAIEEMPEAGVRNLGPISRF